MWCVVVCDNEPFDDQEALTQLGAVAPWGWGVGRRKKVIEKRDTDMSVTAT